MLVKSDDFAYISGRVMCTSSPCVIPTGIALIAR